MHTDKISSIKLLANFCHPCPMWVTWGFDSGLPLLHSQYITHSVAEWTMLAGIGKDSALVWIN